MGQSYSRGYIGKNPINNKAGIWTLQDIYKRQLIDKDWKLNEILNLNPYAYFESELPFVNVNPSQQVLSWVGKINNRNLVAIPSTNSNTFSNNTINFVSGNLGFNGFNLANSVNFTFFIVLAINPSTPNNSVLFRAGNNVFSGANCIITYVNSTTLRITRNGNLETNNVSNINNFNIFEFTVYGNELTIRQNGVILNTVTRNVLNSMSALFELRPSNNIVGEIRSLVIIDRIITNIERNIIEGQLAWDTKNNLVSLLPINHPYKNVPPY